MTLRRIHIAGNNKAYLGLHVHFPRFLSDFNQIWIFSTHFRRSLQHQIMPKSVQVEASFRHVYIRI